MGSTTAPSRPDQSPAPASGRTGGIWQRQLAHYPDNGPRSLYLGITVLATMVLYYELYVGGAVATQIIADLDFSFTVLRLRLRHREPGRRLRLAVRRARRPLGPGQPRRLRAAAHRPDHPLRPPARAGQDRLHGALRAAELRRGRRARRDAGADPRLLAAGRPRRGDGLLDPRPGARQPRRHLGVEQHPRQPPRLALPVLRLRHRRPRRLRHRVRRPAGALAGAARPADGEHARPRADRGPRGRDRPGEGAAGPLAADAALRRHRARPSRSASSCSCTTSSSASRSSTSRPSSATPRPAANALANWYWITNAIALVVTGVLSDRLRVRKPFMIVGGLISIVGRVLFALAATEPDTELLHVRRSTSCSARPAAAWPTSPGWRASPRPSSGTTRRPRRPAWRSGAGPCGIVVTVSLAVFTLVVPATSILVDKAPADAGDRSEHPDEVAVLTAIDQDLRRDWPADPTDTDPLGPRSGRSPASEGAERRRGGARPRPSSRGARDGRRPSTRTSSRRCRRTDLSAARRGGRPDRGGARRRRRGRAAAARRRRRAPTRRPRVGRAVRRRLQAAPAAFPADDLETWRANGPRSRRRRRTTPASGRPGGGSASPARWCSSRSSS